MSSFITGKEKAWLGGLVAGLVALTGQIAVNQQLTLREGIYAVGAWLATHLAVYLTTNSPVTFQPVTPQVVAPTAPDVTPTPPVV